jgi:hypothetical protein
MNCGDAHSEALESNSPRNQISSLTRMDFQQTENRVKKKLDASGNSTSPLDLIPREIRLQCTPSQAQILGQSFSTNVSSNQVPDISVLSVFLQISPE